MIERRKHQSVLLAFALMASCATWTAAQEPTASPAAPSEQPGEADQLDLLFAELAQPDQAEWQRIETEIQRLWSRSGSESVDLLLKRGNDAAAEGEFLMAMDHLSALIDHAPDFAEGWNARATLWYHMGEYTMSIADIEHVLELNPRHFGALQGLAAMLEELGEPMLALKAIREAHRLNPNRPDVKEAVKRLERAAGETEL